MELYEILEDTEAVSELEDFRPFQSRDHMLLYLLVHGARKFVSGIKVMVWLSYTKYFLGAATGSPYIVFIWTSGV